MEITFHLPLFRSRSRIEQTIREVLAEHRDELCRRMTGGTFMVDLSPARSGVEFLDAHSGKLRFEIGGRATLIEEVAFEVDWGRRILLIRTDDGDATSRGNQH